MKRTGKKLPTSNRKRKPTLRKKAGGSNDIDKLGTSLLFLALGFAGIGELVLKVSDAWKKSQIKKTANGTEKDSKPSVVPEWDAFIGGMSQGKQP
jgi:hypothetical protein